MDTLVVFLLVTPIVLAVLLSLYFGLGWVLDQRYLRKLYRLSKRDKNLLSVYRNEYHRIKGVWPRRG